MEGRFEDRGGVEGAGDGRDVGGEGGLGGGGEGGGEGAEVEWGEHCTETCCGLVGNTDRLQPVRMALLWGSSCGGPAGVPAVLGFLLCWS